MPVEILLCYAHADEALLKKLKDHLSPLQKQGYIDIWHDRDISPGTEWEREIDKHLNTDQIILLLVSPAFMASEYCYSREMKRAMERHERGEALVIPIVLRHVYWKGAPFGKLQALPKDAKPITGGGWHNIDEALKNVAEGLVTALEQFMTKPPQPPVEETLLPVPPNGSAINETPQTPIESETSSTFAIKWLSNEGYSTISEGTRNPSTAPPIGSTTTEPPQPPIEETLSPAPPIGSTTHEEPPPPGQTNGSKILEEQPLEKPKPSRSVPPKHQWSKTTKAALIGAVAIIMVGIISTILFLYNPGGIFPKRLSNTPTSTTHSITPTPNILLTTESSPPYFHDALNSTSTQKALWESVGTTSRCIFGSDGYHIQIASPSATEAICHEHRNSYQDFTISIDMVLNGGTGGLLFRDQDLIGGNGAYFFEVNNDGQYQISILVSRTLRGWTSSPAIHRGRNVRNTLQVIATGNLLSFYMNGVYLTSIRDQTFLFGGISLACFNSGEAIFSNLSIYLAH